MSAIALPEIACWRGTQLACQDAITHMIACGHAISRKNADAAGTRETITSVSLTRCFQSSALHPSKRFTSLRIKSLYKAETVSCSP